MPTLSQVVGFRNILIHGYAKVDDLLVWQAVADLPELRAVLVGLLDELDDRDR
ncbi:MAG: HepT-like ribonuclease domain-containing protein [Pseudonocardia sediminis]